MVHVPARAITSALQHLLLHTKKGRSRDSTLPKVRLCMSNFTQLINNPPSFSQTIHRGVTASLCWDRMTLRGLALFVYHDRIFKQRLVYCKTAFHTLTLFSICAPVRYHPHQMICGTVLNLYEELCNLRQSHPDDPSCSAKSETLKRWLSLLDEVISSSHCSQDELLPTIDLASPAPPCSFCGGEIFRTVFRCTRSCVRDDAASDSVGWRILICSHCFVDGRACRCGSMEPYRIQPLDRLIELRAKVAVLLGVSDESSPAWS